MASATLTVGGPCTGWDSDCEGGFLLRACTGNHTAHILAGVGRGDVVEPQLGAVGLSERGGGSRQAKVFGQDKSLSTAMSVPKSFPLGLRSSGLQLMWISFIYRLLHIQPTHFIEESGSGNDSVAEPGERPRGLNSQAGRLLPAKKYFLPWGPQAGQGLHEVWGVEGNCRSNFACPRTAPPWPLYLMPGREAAPTLVPCDLGVGLPRHHAVQVQGLPFSHMR